MMNEFNNLYEFADCRFDGKKGKLWRNNELILLSPKASELLNLLLEKNGEFVSKEEIFENVWKDTFVEDGVLTQNIYTLRKALGNDADGLPIIENKTRLGYRVIVPINLVENSNGIHLSQTAAPTVSENKPTSKKNRKSILIFVSLAIVFSVFGFIGYRYFRPNIASYFRKPIESVKFTQLTNTSDLASATLSPDGNFLAYIRQNKVYLKDVVSNKEIPLEIPNVPSFRALQFSADGNFLYFCNNSAYFAGSKILKVSRFGGDTELIVERNQGLFSLSPDNKFIAYYVGLQSEGNKLIVRNLETREERAVLQLEPLQSSVTNNS